MSGKNIIAFQGISGAHSDLACRSAYPYMNTEAYPTFEEAMDAVRDGKAEMCMIPIENTYAGRVAEIHNLLPKTDLYIVGEYFLPIEHSLLAPKGAALDTVRTAYSHPQAIMQCRENLQKLRLDSHSAANTAIAAKEVAEWNDKSKAAIASPLAGELYGLEVLKEHLEDAMDNTTIFIAMSKEPIDPDPKKDRVITSLLFTLRNIPAALYKAMGGFATNHINLLKIESYIPAGSSQMAQFYIVFEGHPQDKNVQLAVEELGFFSKKVQVLGSYAADPKRFD